MSDLPSFTVDDLVQQFSQLRVGPLTSDDAVDLGLVAVALIRERDLNLCVDVTLDGHSRFRAKLKRTGPGNDSWLDAKAAVAVRFGEPSLLVKLRHLDAGTPFEERTDIDHDRLRAHGGSIPLVTTLDPDPDPGLDPDPGSDPGLNPDLGLGGARVLGTITVSGEPDVVDHSIAAEALRRYLA